MIRFPKTWDEAVAHAGEIRAGGTDLQDRRHAGVSGGDLIDLRDLPGLDTIETDAETGTTRIGARRTLSSLVKDLAISYAYPGLVQTAGGIATAQIRSVATVGGNLLQRSRCWYFKDPGVSCLKTGGDACLARDGDHLYHVCFATNPCVAPHPSTLAMALLTYEAEVEIFSAADRPEDYEPPDPEDAGTRTATRDATRDGAGEAEPYEPPWPTRRIPIADLYGDGADPTRENTLGDDELLVAVHLPAPTPNELSAWFRMMSRAASEWPMAEALVRLTIEAGSITLARVAVAGVASIPLRLTKVEAALEGQPATAETLAAAAALSTDGAEPLPMTGYKLKILEGTVLEALEMALAKAPPEALPQPEPEEPAEGEEGTEQPAGDGEEG